MQIKSIKTVFKTSNAKNHTIILRHKVRTAFQS